MSSGTDTSINCPACQQINEPEMSFCIFCGCGLHDQEDTKIQGGQTCPSCGRFDELNIKFCVLCGSKLKIGTGGDTPPELSRLSWEMDQPRSIPAVRTPARVSPRAKLGSRRGKGKRRLLPIWFAAGALAGSAAAAFASYIGVPDRCAQFGLPTRGLAIYTQAPFIKVIVQDMESKNFTLGSTGGQGTLIIDDLAPSKEYRLKMEGEGYDTAYFSPFKPAANRGTILGFPKRISLPPRHL